MKLAMREIQKKAGTHQSIAARFEINRTILKARLDGKPTLADKATSQHLFILFEEQAIINFIDKATQFGFSAKLYIVKKKTALLVTIQSEINQPVTVGKSWACRFVACHPKLASRFLCHLDQERH